MSLREEIEATEADIKKQIGPSGVSPEGKLVHDDSAELCLGLRHDDERVFVTLGCYVSWFGVNAQGAREFAAALNKAADEVEECQRALSRVAAREQAADESSP